MKQANIGLTLDSAFFSVAGLRDRPQQNLHRKTYTKQTRLHAPTESPQKRSLVVGCIIPFLASEGSPSSNEFKTPRSGVGARGVDTEEH